MTVELIYSYERINHNVERQECFPRSESFCAVICGLQTVLDAALGFLFLAVQSHTTPLYPLLYQPRGISKQYLP